MVLFQSLGIAIFCDELKTIRVDFPTLISKVVIAICQCALPCLSIIGRHHHTNASPHIFVLAIRHARVNPNFICFSKRVRTHTHTRVNCATLIFFFYKYSSRMRGHQHPEIIDKSEPTISMRWSFVMNFHDRQHFATVIIEASTHGRSQRPPNTLPDVLNIYAHKSKPVMAMRLSFLFMMFRDRAHFATVVVEAATNGRYRLPRRIFLAICFALTFNMNCVCLICRVWIVYVLCSMYDRWVGLAWHVFAIALRLMSKSKKMQAHARTYKDVCVCVIEVFLFLVWVV